MPHGDITHVDIPVTDLAAASDFYGGVFGWRIEEYPGYEGYPMWQAPNKLSGGGLAPRGEGFTQPRSTVEVDSIEDTLAIVRERGGTVTMEKTPIDDSSWWATFTDPDGNSIGIYEGRVSGSGAS